MDISETFGFGDDLVIVFDGSGDWVQEEVVVRIGDQRLEDGLDLGTNGGGFGFGEGGGGRRGRRLYRRVILRRRSFHLDFCLDFGNAITTTRRERL